MAQSVVWISLININMFATFGTITLLLVFLQNSVCLQGKTRSKRGFVFDSEEISGSSLSRVFDELIHLDNHLDDVKQSVIEHVHDHVETKLDHQEEILMQILNKQRTFQFIIYFFFFSPFLTHSIMDDNFSRCISKMFLIFPRK